MLSDGRGSEPGALTVEAGAQERVATANAAVEPPSRCPRRAKAAKGVPGTLGSWIRLEDLWAEPFRLFFPLALLAGVCGVMIWPFVLWGWADTPPSVPHTRLMALGFMGGFVLGFLGTSVPRLLDARPLGRGETVTTLSLHALACAFYLFNWGRGGDIAMAFNVVFFAGILILRVPTRKSLPAPSFLLLAPALGALLAGLVMAELSRRAVWSQHADVLSRLLMYHAFLLLSVLGAGAFLLPRFLGLGLRRKYQTEGRIEGAWARSAVIALALAGGVLATYLIDVLVSSAVGSSIRAALVIGYLAWEMPLERLRFSREGVDWILVLGLLSVPIGMLAAGWRPIHRVALSHIELAGGMGMITLGVATRVAFGHTGNRALLKRFHPWLTAAAVLMILGYLSRIAGEMMPRLLVSHYIYGGLCWALGGVIWACCVLRHILKPDPEA